MKKLLEKLKLKRAFKKKRDEDSYDHEKDIAHSSDVKARVALAGNSKTHQEILYYMAEQDDSAEVRAAVARNKSTPVQASPILAGDVNKDVRMALAERLVVLLPDLNAERHSQLYAFAVQALGTLALDEVLKIRKALASSLKDYADTPPKVANQLARDIEREVSEPILKYCTAVTDDALLEILQVHPATWAVQAIAGRKTLAEKISDAVIRTKDKPAGSILLQNAGAEISEATLEDIIERAREYPEWQTHLAGRANLPPKMAKKLAEFADRSVRKILIEKQNFDDKTAEDIAGIFRRRLEFAGEGEQSGEDSSAEARVLKLAKKNELTEEVLADALGMRDSEFVMAGLAHLAGTTTKDVQRIMALKAGKPIVALTWKAKLPMRFALRLQKELGQVQPKDLVYPRDGTDYPLTHDELLWQLEFLGIKAA